MARQFECEVTQPPTGVEVLERALVELARGEFELTLQPTDVDVPKMSPIELTLRLRSLTHGLDGESSIRAAVVTPSEGYGSVFLTVPKDESLPATATVITQ